MKNKLFPFISILILVLIFGTAAICNMCGLSLSTTTTTAETTTKTSAGNQTASQTTEENVQSATSKTTTSTEETIVENTEETTADITEETTEETISEDTETEDTEEVIIGEGSGEGVVFTPAVNKNLSGYIIKDTSVITRVVMVGDTGSNKETKGYISFDISDLMDSPVVNAELKISDIVAAVDPTFADQLNIKVFDYGDSLDNADFAVGGSSLASFSTSGLTNINISDDNLKDLIKKSIEADKQYFQIKLGLSTATDNDGTADLFAINLDLVKLTVQQ